ncbi:hypothetical protein BaRGS_00016635, partial [Batillaria attramentaria]
IGFFVTILFYVCLEVAKIGQDGLAAWLRSPWTWIELASIILSLTLLTLHLVRLQATAYFRKNWVRKMDADFISSSEIRIVEQVLRNVQVPLVATVMLQMSKCVRFTPIAKLTFKSFENGLSALANLTAMTWLIILSFAICFNLMLGVQSDYFATVFDSLFQVFALPLGLDYFRVFGYDNYLGGFLYFCFVFVLVLMLLQFFTAILVEGMEMARAADRFFPQRDYVSEYVWVKILEFFGISTSRIPKRQKTPRWNRPFHIVESQQSKGTRTAQAKPSMAQPDTETPDDAQTENPDQAKADETGEAKAGDKKKGDKEKGDSGKSETDTSTDQSKGGKKGKEGDKKKGGKDKGDSGKSSTDTDSKGGKKGKEGDKKKGGKDKGDSGKSSTDADSKGGKKDKAKAAPKGGKGKK